MQQFSCVHIYIYIYTCLQLTGASSGIGASIAEHLFQEGAKVMMGARRLPQLTEVQTSAQTKYPDSPGKLAVKECDVTSESSVAELVKAAETDLGEVNVLINCAGVMCK